MKNGIENLDYRTESWLAQLKELDSNDIIDELNKKIILYRLSQVIQNAIPTFIITPVSVNLRKNGGYGKYNEYRYNPSKPSKYLKTIDYGILNNLNKMLEDDYYTDVIHCSLEGRRGAKIFAEVLGTGRCFWSNSDDADTAEKILTLGVPRKAETDWKINDNATQQFICNTKEGSSYTIPTSPAWYIDLNKNSCGILESKIDNDKLALLLQSPPISISETESIRKSLKDITAKDAALPKILPEAKVHKITPTAHLYLTQGFCTKNNR